MRELPDYDGASLLNLMSTVLAACGGRADHAPLRELSPERLAGARNLVLLVVDGLGYEYLTHRHRDSLIARHLHARLTSVFPTTTASALTTLLSGLSPQEHGLPGWFTWLREVGSVTAVLPFRARVGSGSLDTAGVPLESVLGWPSLFDRMSRDVELLNPQYIVDSPFSVYSGGRARRTGVTDLAGLFTVLAKRLRRPGPPRYIHAYWPDLDSLAHRFGIGSERVDAHFAAVDSALAKFLDAAQGTDTTLLITADHGLVDTSPEQIVQLARHPELARTLRLPLCGEPRAAYCYLEPGAETDFVDYVRAVLHPHCTVYASRALLDQGWFGRGAVHPRFAERIGDYTLVMKGHGVITDRLLGERPFEQIGVHGGLNSAELYVPLALFSL